ncbi:MAG TPA: MlaD family protein [Thermoanaerobaculia bacterium]|nr:MlaD family protein [Thermoanaerobaculia bacterium]
MNSAAKVGVFFVIVLILAGVLIWQIQGLRIGKGHAQRISVEFPDIVGLNEKSTVRISGVPVGKVAKIHLGKGGKGAIVDLDIDNPDVNLRLGASATVANLGLLGEKYVELVPGPVGAHPLPENSTIQGEVPVSFDEITKLARDIEVDIKEISHNLNKSLGGPEGEERLKTIVENVRIISDDLRVMISSNRGNVDSTMANFREFSGMMTKLVERIDRLVESNQSNVTGSIANIREISSKLETTADNLNQITGRIQSGEGTVGKLVQSDETHKNLNDALLAVKEGVGGINKALGSVGKIKLDLGLRSEYLTGQSSAKGYVTLDVNKENSPQFYELELSTQPLGRRVSTITQETRTFPDGHREVTTIDSQQFKDELAITALFGYRLGNWAGRAGIIESRGGAAIDYRSLKDRLRFSAELFDFSRPDYSAHGKLTARYYFSPSIFVTGGWDDFLNRSRKADSLFLGAGIRWSDDDIKYLLGSIPRP